MTHVVLLIPVVNIIMHFIWAFDNGNLSRRNFCRARLILFAIFLALACIAGVFLLLFTGVFAGLLNHKIH